MAIAESILFQINSSNYTAPIATIYKPASGFSGFITTLRLTINLKSIDEANFPYIPDDTPPDVLQEILANIALNTEFREIILYQKKGTGDWIERAPIRIFNKEPYYDVNLMRYFSDSNTIDVAEDLSLGIQIKIGNVLTSADTILVWGSVVAEKKNNGNEELADRISALETLLSVYGAPSASLPGTNGLVPAPPAGGEEFLLRGDREWQNPNAFATSADIDQAITAWIGAAPGHLNTLIEFGNAINNDASFASTITNALSLKAPIANPSFTGFVGLGGNTALKFQEFTGTTNDNGDANFSLGGISILKIRGVEILVNGFAPCYLNIPFGGSAEYNYFMTGGVFYIVSGTNKNSLLNVLYTVLIKYVA